jgi:hypothetical protein
MSTKRSISFPLLPSFALLIVAVASCKTTTEAERPQMSRVIGIKGHARYTEDHGNTWHEIKKGHLIPPEAAIQTASGMANAVTLAVGGRYPDKIVLFDSSILKLEQVTTKTVAGKEIGDMRLLILCGSAVGAAGMAWPSDKSFLAPSAPGPKMESIKKQPDQPYYEIKTSNTVVHVQRGLYFLSATGLTRILQGSATLEFTDTGATKDIFAGEEFNPNSGEVGPDRSSRSRRIGTAELGVDESAAKKGSPVPGAATAVLKAKSGSIRNVKVEARRNNRYSIPNASDRKSVKSGRLLDSISMTCFNSVCL